MRAVKNLMFITLPLLIIFLLILEFLLRAFFPVPDPYCNFKNRSYNSFYSLRDACKSRYRLASHEGLVNMDTAMTYNTNNVGFRGDSLHIPKPQDEIRVFIVGGSTTQCPYIDDSKAVHTVIQRELKPAKIYLPRAIFLAATDLQIGRRLYYQSA